MILNDYPFTKRLMNILKEEYDDEVIDKGNTWRKDCTINYLFEKNKESKLLSYRKIKIVIIRW